MFLCVYVVFSRRSNKKPSKKTYPTFFPRAQILLGSTLIFTRFSFYARCAATLTAVSARDSGMVFAQPPQRNSQQTFLSLGAAMKSYSFLHSLYKLFALIISPDFSAVNLFGEKKLFLCCFCGVIIRFLSFGLCSIR